MTRKVSKGLKAPTQQKQQQQHNSALDAVCTSDKTSELISVFDKNSRNLRWWLSNLYSQKFDFIVVWVWTGDVSWSVVSKILDN